MQYTLETADSIKCHNCDARKKGEKGFFCDRYGRQLEHYRDRSGVWVNKCDECICGEA